MPGLADGDHDVPHLRDPVGLGEGRIGAVVGRVAQFQVADALEHIRAAHQFGDEVGQRFQCLERLHQRVQF